MGPVVVGIGLTMGLDGGMEGLLMVLGLWGFCVASVKVNKAKSGNASEIMPQSCRERAQQLDGNNSYGN